VIEPVLRKAVAGGIPGVQVHASVTEKLLRDPNAGFELAIQEAKRAFVLGKER
jgi:hypothetical protein